jgi:hypothetical protein
MEQDEAKRPSVVLQLVELMKTQLTGELFN